MRVVVRVLTVLVVDMRVRVGLSVVTVLVLVLDMVMIMQDMSVRMRHVLVRVLMGVLCCGHLFSVLRAHGDSRNHLRMDRAPLLIDATRRTGIVVKFFLLHIDAPILQLA